MKKWISVLLTISCLVIIFLGQMHWNEKTTVTATDSSRKDIITQSGTNNSNKKVAVDVSTLNSLLSYTKNWPAESIDQFNNKLENGETYKILIVGSHSLGNGEDSWPEIVKRALINTYKEHIEVSILSYDLTSAEFISQNLQEEITKKQADLILFEPFTLKDNGVVTIDDSHQNLLNTITNVKASNPETVFIIQPPHPLYDANYYPIQVDALQKFAEANGLTYLHHWDAWPNATSTEIKDYLTEDSSEPSPSGHQLWADYIIHYFIYED